MRPRRRLLDKRGRPLRKPQPLHLYIGGRWHVLPGPVAERVMEEHLADLVGMAKRLAVRRSVQEARRTDRRLREAFERGDITVGMAEDSQVFRVDPNYAGCRRGKRLLESRRK